MKINEKKSKYLALLLTATLVIQLAASFYNYCAISNITYWVYHILLAFNGMCASLLWIGIMQKNYDKKKTNGSSLVFYSTPWVAYYSIFKPFLWPTFTWIEAQLYAVIPMQ